MFEVPENQENLMNEYKGLIIKKINESRQKTKGNPFVSSKDIVHALSPLCEEDLTEMLDEIAIPVYGDNSHIDMEMFKDFIESRIGEDFVVLEGLENHVFCLHTVEDFVKDLLFTKNDIVTQSNKARFNEIQEAA